MGKEEKEERPKQADHKTPILTALSLVNSAYLPQFYKNEIKIRKG